MSLQGWSKFYEFSTADLRSGTDVIAMALKAGEGKCQVDKCVERLCGLVGGGGGGEGGGMNLLFHLCICYPHSLRAKHAYDTFSVHAMSSVLDH